MKFLVFLLFLFASHVSAEILTQCYSIPVSRGIYDEANICISLDTQSQNKSHVLWHFACGGMDETSFSIMGKSIREEWNKLNVDAPLVVSISFSRLFFLLSEMDQEPYTGLLDSFFDELFPQIEKKLLKDYGIIKNNQGGAGVRFGYGYSMGGYNLLRILFKKRQIFSRYFIGSPALQDRKIELSDPRIDRQISRQKFYLLNIALLKDIHPNIIWMVQNPLTLAKIPMDSRENLPKIMVGYGTNDALYMTSEYLFKLLQKSHWPVERVIIEGANHLFGWDKMGPDIAGFLAP